MQRSRSSATSGDSGIGFLKTRFASRNRLSPGPYASAWSCSGHSPPRSQIGQSSGWFSRRNSRFARWASATSSSLACVITDMPAATGTVHEVASFGWPSIRT